jgi:nitrogenase molybdenum-iron protein NifN
MGRIKHPERTFLTDPFRIGQPLGAAMAFLGVRRGAPLMLGARGCAAVGMALLVRHYGRPVPIETLALDETSLALGDRGELEAALLALHERSAPELAGLLGAGLGEARGDDVEGLLRKIWRGNRRSHPALAAMEAIFTPCPDFSGAYQDGWSAAVCGIVAKFVQPAGRKNGRQVNVLAGSHLTPGDVEEVKEALDAFGLEAIVLPDISGGFGSAARSRTGDGGVCGVPLADIRRMGASVLTIAIGEHMRPTAECIEKRAGVPFRVFDRLVGLGPCDDFMALLADVSGAEAPNRLKRQRSRLVDAMLTAYPAFCGARAAVAGDPDHLLGLCSWLSEMGAAIGVAVSTTDNPVLWRVPALKVIVGDLGDFERGAEGADLLVAPSGARHASRRLGAPLLRAGMPISDRVGAAHKVSVGYRGTLDLIFEAANLLLERRGDPNAPE